MAHRPGIEVARPFLDSPAPVCTDSRIDEVHDVVLWFRNGTIGAQPAVGGLDTLVHPNGSNLNFHKVWLKA